MPQGFLIGRLFGTNVYLSPGFLLLLGLYFWRFGAGYAAVFSVAIIVSLLVHEFGHVFAVKWFLKSESRVLLWMLGGLCIHEPTRDTRKQIGISLMGPAFGFVLGALSFLATAFAPATAPDSLRQFLAIMIFVNVFWTAINLLPIQPLDGGQALRAALEGKLGAARANAISRRVSIGTAAAGAGAALLVGWPVAAVLCGLLIFQNLSGPGGGL